MKIGGYSDSPIVAEDVMLSNVRSPLVRYGGAAGQGRQSAVVNGNTDRLSRATWKQFNHSDGILSLKGLILIGPAGYQSQCLEREVYNALT